MKTIELEKEEIYCGNLLLVNKNYPLRDNNVKGLVPADVRFPNILMKRDVANVLQLIFEKISAGNSIVPVSGYRSLEEQTAIYDGSLKDNGEDFTRKYVALPNHSEHQTGLAIDLGLKILSVPISPMSVSVMSLEKQPQTMDLSNAMQRTKKKSREFHTSRGIFDM